MTLKIKCTFQFWREDLKAFRPVSVPRAGCLIVAVVEEAEPQL